MVGKTSAKLRVPPSSIEAGLLKQNKDARVDSTTAPVMALGDMCVDSKIIDDILRNLPFSDSAYTGNLRVVIAAAGRIQEHARNLLKHAMGDKA